MEAHDLSPEERVPASRKLGRDRAAELAAEARRLVVMKGKSVKEASGDDLDSLVDDMLGPTGNLRAPTLVVGDTVLVGFNEDVYAGTLTR